MHMLTGDIADVPNPMFYMPGTRMLFGDASKSTNGKDVHKTRFVAWHANLMIALKAAIEAKLA